MPDMCGCTVQMQVPRTSQVTSVPVGAHRTTRFGKAIERVTVMGLQSRDGWMVMVSSSVTWMETRARPSWSGSGSRCSTS
jgi:hypothetical protein